MSCGCAYVEVEEGSSILDQSTVTARKTYQCGVCHRDIIPGEKYERARDVWDGVFSTFKTCSDCLSIRDEFFCGSYCFYFMDDLEYHLDGIQGQVKSECLESLTPAARARVIDMIDRLWEES